MTLPTLTPLNVIGDPANHDQNAWHVLTGKADFTADRLVGGYFLAGGRKFYGAIKTSEIARGSIKSIDTAKALAEPGVLAVVTYKDVPTWTQGIFQWGQEVAGVVADDPYTAFRALPLIGVTYDTAAAVFSPDAAIAPGAPLSGVRPDTNLATPTNLTRGDIAAGFKDADVTVETTFPYTTTYQHNTLEPHQCFAWWVGDDLYFWTPSQHIHAARATVVSALGLTANRVHAYTHFTGGGHGDKTGAPAAPPCAILSRIIGGAPVLLLESRKENILTNTRQFEVRSAIRLGAKKDGTIMAIDATWWGNGGRNPNAPIANVHFGVRTTYNIPNAKFTVNSIVTNQPPRGFWRCVNDPPGNMNSDSALDKLAAQLNMDPYQLRLKNIMPADAPDLDAPKRVWGNGGAGVGVRACLERVFTESGYASKWHAPGTKTLPDGRAHGIAITGHLDSHGGVNGASRGGIVTMTPDGKALVDVGGARGCEGGPTVCVHVVAETLGMVYGDVRIGEWGNTDISLDSGIQAGSGFTGGAGSAFYNAALDLRNKLFAYAVNKEPFLSAKATPADLSAKGSSVFLTSDPTKTLTYRQVMTGTPPTAGSGNGWASSIRGRTIGNTKVGDPANSNGGAAACAEVAVDTDTGEVEVLGLWNAVDTGRTIFRQGTIKEMNSGNELIVCQALFYGDMYDVGTAGTGALIGTHYTDSQFPTPKDMNTDNFKVFDIESDDSAGPYGAHGIGEPCCTNYSAIVNAIFNATGKWVNPHKGPCQPDRVLEALGKATIGADTAP